MKEEDEIIKNQEYYSQYEPLNNPIQLNASQGRILVSAKSHWGKTYLIQKMLLDFRAKGWEVNILSYTKESEVDYWKELEKSWCKITYADTTDYKTLMNFFFSVKANSVIYIDDLDLYLNDQADNLKEAINIIKDFFSASRKANIITIYSVKSIKGPPWTTFVEMAEVLFLGKFNRFSNAWNAFGIDDLEYKMEHLPEHSFIMKSDEGVHLVKAEPEGIVDLVKYRKLIIEKIDEEINKKVDKEMKEREEQQMKEKEDEEEDEKRKEIEEENNKKELEEMIEKAEKEKDEEIAKRRNKEKEMKAKAKKYEEIQINKNRKYITFYKLQIYLLFLVGALFSFTSIYIWLILIPIIFLFYRKDKAEKEELINYQNRLIDLGQIYSINKDYELNYTSINSKSYYIYDKTSKKLVKKEPNPEYIGKLKYKANLTKSTVKIAGVFYIYQFILFILLSAISINAVLSFASGITIIGLVILMSYFIDNLIARLSSKLFVITLFEILFGFLAVFYLSYLILPILIAIILNLTQINKHG